MVGRVFCLKMISWRPFLFLFALQNFLLAGFWQLPDQPFRIFPTIHFPTKHFFTDLFLISSFVECLHFMKVKLQLLHLWLSICSLVFKILYLLILYLLFMDFQLLHFRFQFVIKSAFVCGFQILHLWIFYYLICGVSLSSFVFFQLFN